jgi:hypothetical protein
LHSKNAPRCNPVDEEELFDDLLLDRALSDLAWAAEDDRRGEARIQLAHGLVKGPSTISLRGLPPVCSPPRIGSL